MNVLIYQRCVNQHELTSSPVKVQAVYYSKASSVQTLTK